MGMCGNGAAIGMAIIRPNHKPIQPGFLPDHVPLFAVEAGIVLSSTADRHTVPVMIRPH
jgi:hypothetical protein